MEIFRHLWTAVSVCMDYYGSFCDNLFNKLCLVVIRPGIAMEIGFTKRNRCRKCGLPVDSPLTLFWDCKNSPGVV